MTQRVLLKISGEQLGGEQESGIDAQVAHYLADECKKVVEAGHELVIMVGGGNLVRGANVAGNGISRTTADHMGMLSTMINALAVTDIFENQGLATRCLSNIFAPQVAESYAYKVAQKNLARKRIVILAGGTGRPYFTTDTGAVNLALEMECNAVLKATKVDGVYDRDPAKFPDATRLPSLTLKQAVEDPDIRVMDKAALALAFDNSLPIVVFDLMQPENILKAVQGDSSVGTRIS